MLLSFARVSQALCGQAVPHNLVSNYTLASLLLLSFCVCVCVCAVVFLLLDWKLFEGKHHCLIILYST